MGVTIKCEKTGANCDLGYGGFKNFRERVAYLLNDEFGKHYEKLFQIFIGIGFGDERHKRLAEEFDRETERLIKKHKISKRAAGFLFQADCGGKIPPSACKVIYGAIQDYDDNICYGYAGRKDCAMFSDLKALFKDCCDTNSYLIWH